MENLNEDALRAREKFQTLEQVKVTKSITKPHWVVELEGKLYRAMFSDGVLIPGTYLLVDYNLNRKKPFEARKLVLEKGDPTEYLIDYGKNGIILTDYDPEKEN